MVNTRRKLQFGVYLPDFGRAIHPRALIELAGEAEDYGWDGFFLWDHLVEWNRHTPVYDAFTCLAAIATNTKHIRIGTAVTPIPILKPWIIARQTITLDQLSNGRLILGVGLGGKGGCDYERFGESGDNRVLAEKLDESLDIISGLWSGKPFRYTGKHYVLKDPVFLAHEIQEPRIPIWVAGYWPRKGPFRRAAKWDGVIPLRFPGNLLEPNEVRTVVEYIKTLRGNADGFAVAIIGSTMNQRRNIEKVERFANAGMTWWFENLYAKRDSFESVRRLIRLGPPNVKSQTL
jgi:alkanesulfonate monooxygenase SsuD/methylene tetrahydromethanopterin reductase-like flavin-dependent oxidoreductase (luciferase family)